MEYTPVRIGILGCGTVGQALVALINEQREVISSRTGLDLTIESIAVRNPNIDRNLDGVSQKFSGDAGSVAVSENIDIVVELIGGVDPAKELLESALLSGKPVVTANKELLAKHGPELFEIADRGGVDLLFEAAVAGGVRT